MDCSDRKDSREEKNKSEPQIDYDLEQYKILFDLIKHDHTRSNDNLRAFLFVHSILLVAVNSFVTPLSYVLGCET